MEGFFFGEVCVEPCCPLQFREELLVGLEVAKNGINFCQFVQLVAQILSITDKTSFVKLSTWPPLVLGLL